ncbi:nuclear transport factor 2 family protein [Spirosoma flavum]|uniref:Nuclear transport factor 2 family protein n=1 Tax=Spirosoma flavum TaxID=2048557 RepID=A0ABW6ARI1_9BACT
MSTIAALPQLITALMTAQNNYDSNGFAALFAANAIVHDAGETYNGPAEIKQWNEATNEKYRVTLEPAEFLTHENGGILTVMVSGNFAGSPAPLKYNFAFDDEKINTLSITS